MFAHISASLSVFMCISFSYIYNIESQSCWYVNKYTQKREIFGGNGIKWGPVGLNEVVLRKGLGTRGVGGNATVLYIQYKNVTVGS